MALYDEANKQNLKNAAIVNEVMKYCNKYECIGFLFDTYNTVYKEIIDCLNRGEEWVPFAEDTDESFSPERDGDNK
jgi:proteasome lid subunit RPN8/RPN11